MFCSVFGIGDTSQQPCRDCQELLTGYSRSGPGETILQDRYNASSEPVAQDFDPHPRSFPLGSAITFPVADVTGADAQVIIGVNQIALIAAGTLHGVSLVAFGELAERLAGMKPNNAIAVSGRVEVNGWLDKAGEPKAGLSLVVDELAALKGKARPPQGARPSSPSRAQPVAAGFDDELPDWH